MGYDRRFRLRVAANPTLTWANIDTTLWSLAFAGQASASHYRHCFCLSHTTDQYDWAPDPQPFKSLYTTTYQYPQEQKQLQCSPPICKAWNNDPHPLCPIPHCSYKHIAGIASVIPIKDISALMQAAPLPLLILKVNLYSDNNLSIY